MEHRKVVRIKTISEALRLQQLTAPAHRLICIIDCAALKDMPDLSVVLDFYTISLKRNCDKLFFGHKTYDCGLQFTTRKKPIIQFVFILILPWQRQIMRNKQML